MENENREMQLETEQLEDVNGGLAANGGKDKISVLRGRVKDLPDLAINKKRKLNCEDEADGGAIYN